MSDPGKHGRIAAGKLLGAKSDSRLSGRTGLPGCKPRTIAALLLLLLTCLATNRTLALDPARALTQYQTKHWGPEDGLPCNNILSVIQTTDGYLWLGTEEGVVRFDGNRTRIFDREHHAALVDNHVSQVIEDGPHPGRLLIADSVGGVLSLTGDKVQALSANTAPTHQPGRIMVQDPADGALWVGTMRGLFRVDASGKITDPTAAGPGWPTEVINTLCLDQTGRLWVGSDQGIYRREKTAAGPRFVLQPACAGKTVECLLPAHGGGLWVGSREAGLGRLDADGILHPFDALTRCWITALLEDRAGNLWAGTYGSGLYRFPAGTTTGASAAVLTDDTGLASNVVNDLREDREGNLWVATQGGLQMFRDALFTGFGQPEGLASSNVLAVFEDQAGRFWLGCDKGLGSVNPADGRITNYPWPPSSRSVDSIVTCVAPGDEQGALLVGTHTGLWRWRGGKLEPLPLRDDLDGSTVRCFCFDAAGDRWIGTSNGLYQVHAGRVSAHLTAADGLANDVVRALLLDRRGNLWIATDAGLGRREPDGRITNFLTARGGVFSLLEDPARPGDIFAGTEFGLHRLRPREDGTAGVITYTTREGLFDDSMWTLLDDGRGNLWMDSNKGIARVAWADLDRFDRKQIASLPRVVYGVQDGLRSREGNGGHQPAGWRDHAGRLWFAMVKGAAMIDPARLAVSTPSPPVKIEELTANGLSIPTATDRPVELPADTRKLELQYAALNLGNPEGTRLRYRLDPFEKGWTEAGEERAAHYTNLPPGNYRFLVQAAGGDGAWDTDGTAFAFTLLPHVYQRAWFQLLGFAAVVAIGWGWLRLHKRHLVARLDRAEADVRERKRYQEVLSAANEQAERARIEAERARAEAERANEAKSQFLSRTSHELRTPLNAILGFGQLLEMSELPTMERESTAHILKAGRHLLNLVNDVLDIARIEAGQAHLSLEPVVLWEVARECLHLVQRMALQRGVALKTGGLTELGPYVMADRQRLRQVLLNLLANAIKYNREDGTVTLSCRALPPAPPTGSAPADHYLRIEITDTGLGLSADEIARLFVPFERLRAENQNIEGSGLGLALSKPLVEAMGGRIGAESEVGTGSTFWVELPLAEDPCAQVARANLPTPESLDGVPGVVLYIEDNLSNLRLVECLLGRFPGVELLSAMQGGLGLEIARANRPDLILLDLHLPDIPGWEVLAALQADASLREIPVVVVSADVTGRQIERLKRAGARAYLTKPLDVGQFLAVLHEHLRRGEHVFAPASP